MRTNQTFRRRRVAAVANRPALEVLGDFRVTISASDEEVSAVLGGRLTATSVAVSARQILDPIRRANVREVTIDGSQLTYCDGAGIGLIGEIRRATSLAGGSVRFRGFSQELQTLIDLSALPDPSAPQLRVRFECELFLSL